MPVAEHDALLIAAQELCAYGPNENMREALRKAGKKYSDVLSAIPADTGTVVEGREPRSDFCKHQIHMRNACGLCVPPRGTS